MSCSLFIGQCLPWRCSFSVSLIHNHSCWYPLDSCPLGARHSVPLGFQNPDIQNERRRPKVNRVHYDAMRYTIQTIKYIYIIQPTNYIMNHLILCTQKHFTPPPFTPGSYEELPWGAASGLSRHHFFLSLHTSLQSLFLVPKLPPDASKHLVLIL